MLKKLSQVLLIVLLLATLSYSSSKSGADTSISEKKNKTEAEHDKESTYEASIRFGDILIPRDLKLITKLWPNGRVPYTFDQFLDARSRVTYRNAMLMWQRNTCIRFVLKTIVDDDFLMLAREDICTNYVGRQGGMQKVSIGGDDCSTTGHVAHILGHALGLLHEHTRPDRDEYIQYHQGNVFDKRDRVNFLIVNSQQFKEMPFVRYDVQSIMHFSPFAFSVSSSPGKETITVRANANLPELNCTNTLPMGQRMEPSYLDNKRLSVLYGCEFNLEEPECVLPTSTATTPPATTQSVTMRMPTPTTTTKVIQPQLDKKLRSGNVIVLKFVAGKDDDGEKQFGGVQCVPKPGCTPTRQACTNQGGDSCIIPESQFQIINHPSFFSSAIRSENTVLLRSFNKPAYWLDCSELTRCRMTQCHEDYIEEPANSTYISNCSRHHLQIYGARNSGTRLSRGKRMLTKHRVQLKYGNHGFVNCNNHICHILQEGTCPSNPLQYTAPITETTCQPQTFTITKTKE